ncbi:hypothetical protein [Pararobbsia silviterrae]|nr:hypothetical protein [Pararobbsia silviterrae]
MTRKANAKDGRETRRARLANPVETDRACGLLMLARAGVFDAETLQ